MAKNLMGLYKENTFGIKLPNIKWRTRYSLTNFDDHFGLHASVIFRPQYMRGFWYIYMLFYFSKSSQLAKLIVYIIPQK